MFRDFKTNLIMQFWKWFKENNSAYIFINQIEDVNEKERLLDNLMNQLHKYSDKLYFQIGGHPQEDQELIITAEGNSDYFHTVEELIAHAPPLDNWRFIAFLQPNSDNDFHINYEGVVLASNEMWFLPLDHEDSPSLIGLRICIKNYDSLKNNQWLQPTVYKIVDTLVGEKAFALDIDYIEIDELPEEPKEDGMIELTGLSSYIEWHKSNHPRS
jgi:hypothetical protein